MQEIRYPGVAAVDIRRSDGRARTPHYHWAPPRRMRKLLLAEGWTVKIMMVGRKGAKNLRRDLGRNIVERKDFQGVRQLTFAHAEKCRLCVLFCFVGGVDL